jgi:hypothetical protein
MFLENKSVLYATVDMHSSLGQQLNFKNKKKLKIKSSHYSRDYRTELEQFCSDFLIPTVDIRKKFPKLRIVIEWNGFYRTLIAFAKPNLQNELNVMYSGDEDDELFSVDRFGPFNLIEVFSKKHKNNQKIRKRFEYGSL